MTAITKPLAPLRVDETAPDWSRAPLTEEAGLAAMMFNGANASADS